MILKENKFEEEKKEEEKKFSIVITDLEDLLEKNS